MVILQSSSFHSGGHASQRVISLTPRGAGSQRSHKTAGGERVCIINQRHSCLYPCISMTLARCCQSHLHGFPRTKDRRPNHTRGQTARVWCGTAVGRLQVRLCCTVLLLGLNINIVTVSKKSHFQTTGPVPLKNLKKK